MHDHDFRRVLSALVVSGVMLFGPFGFTLNVDADGILSPIVESIKITSVLPDSPADKAGIKVGDDIIEIAGKQIPGGEAFSVTLVAAASPAAR
jgi:C-terminal processing protease CtpA/Prc